MAGVPRRFAILATAAAVVSCATTPKVVTREGIQTEDHAGCGETIAQLGVRRADYQRQLRAGRAAELFAAGQPQPQAERALRPGLDLSISLLDGRSPPLSLACRTWVCQLTIRVEGRAGYSLRTTGNERRIHGYASGPSYRDVDPTTGNHLSIDTQWVLLRDPKGEEVSREELEAQARTSQPVPADLGECRAVAAKLHEEVERLGQEVLALPNHTDERFSAGAPNPALAEETAASILRVLALPPRAAAEVVVCRANVCEAQLPIDEVRLRALEEDDRFWSRVDRVLQTFSSRSSRGLSGTARRTTQHRVLFVLSDGPTRANGRRVVRRLMDQVASELPHCAALAPARGGLTVSVSLPAAKAGDPPPKLAVDYQGSARDTAFGRCLVGLADARLLQAGLPQPVSPHWESRAFLFPPEPDPPSPR
jgi:hypothetical protein